MIVREDVFTRYLLQSTIPSIRYQTLTGLLGLRKNEPRVAEARQAIVTDGPVPAILAQQADSGAWKGERGYYTPKYVSTHWSMTLLAELGADGLDARFRKGAEHMLEATADELSQRMQTGTLGFSCFWGNLLRYTVQAGLVDDPRLERVVEYAAQDLLEGPCRCVHNTDAPCAWGVVRTLWGLAALPRARRTGKVAQAIEHGTGFLLDSFSLVEANYPLPGSGKISPHWFNLNFPLFYQVDILFTLRVLDELGLLGHLGAQPALDWLERQRGKNGRWPGDSPFRQRTWRGMGSPTETTRWVSLQAARILLHAGRIHNTTQSS